MNRPEGDPEITFTVEGAFTPMPRRRPNRHGQLRIPSDHPAHEQQQRIRLAALAAGAVPTAHAAFEIECVIHGRASVRLTPASKTLMAALEGVVFEDRQQVVRIVTCREPQEDGKPPRFTVVIKRLQNLIDTF